MQRRHEAPELGSAVRRFLRALAVRATEGDLEAIEELAQLAKDVDASLGQAIAGARAAKGYTWQAVAELLGTSRQAVQQRFHEAAAPEVYPCDYGCGQLFPTEVRRAGHHVQEHGEERCPKTHTPRPQRCVLPTHHTGLRHVMGAEDDEAPDNLTEELETQE